ncbi:helix-turn-helix domain-containing protein [Austwickia chelonae]|uniref:helix-turn-helix domain-containing protein n=1 Tax=Austwickia chelonae TaxID=100225 RepID=UPI000E283C09|nr:helix-turn-helix domain-containing protein [Austwickia chelonae]
MGAELPQRRSITAKEAAKRFGISERSIRRIIAEPREEYLTRAARRRAEALSLREQGLPYSKIAEQIGCPLGTAKRLVHDARRYLAQQETDKQSPSAGTTDS